MQEATSKSLSRTLLLDREGGTVPSWYGLKPRISKRPGQEMLGGRHTMRSKNSLSVGTSASLNIFTSIIYVYFEK